MEWSYNIESINTITILLTETQFFLGSDKRNKYATSYSYDENGNMTMNLNQGIDSISYNEIGKPCHIQMVDGGKVDYVYSASGEKLQVTHTFPLTGEREVTDYCGDLVYTNKQQESVLFDGGYMLQMENKRIPFFYVKDYQGNNRVVYNDNDFENQWIDYYPFGGISYSNVHHDQQCFFYNGKELDQLLGLFWYDYGARMYDGIRFTTMDPMAELHPEKTPYAFCDNNPIKNIDPDGRDWYENEEKTAAFWQEGHDETAEVDGVTYQNVGETYDIAYDWGIAHFRQYEYINSDTKTTAYIKNGIDVMDCLSNGFTKEQFTPRMVSTAIDYSVDNNTKGLRQLERIATAARPFMEYEKYSKKLVLINAASDIYNGYKADGNHWGYNASMAAGTNAANYFGSTLGVNLGATFGAFVGSSFDGVGAVPGAIFGGILGGYMGGTYSEKLATNLINKIYKK